MWTFWSTKYGSGNIKLYNKDWFIQILKGQGRGDGKKGVLKKGQGGFKREKGFARDKRVRGMQFFQERK